MKNNFFKRFNILHIVWLFVLPLSWFLIRGIEGQSHNTFFGAAETEGQTLNSEYDVVVKELKIKVGQQIKVGDTLALFMRADFANLNRQGIEKNQEIKQYEVEKQSKVNEINREISILDGKKEALLTDLEAQIKILQLENNVQTDLKKILSGNTEGGGSNIKNEKINVLRDAIKKTEQQIRQQKSLLQAQIKSSQAVLGSKIEQSEQAIGFIENEKKELFMLATMDGFIENIFVGTNEVAPQYKPLFKINPKKPNRVKGFIYENSNWVFSLGDSVVLSSSARLDLTTNGIIIGCSPQLVELPIRLRKFSELKTWGREIYIQLPATNDYYIGEKVMIKPM
jgi:DNA-binding XRE family transcriptional regulator